MSVIDTISLVAGVTGVAFGTRCYIELHRWAKQCQNARIAIAHKKRVQIDAPLTDWIGWANQLNDDQKERGRIVYRNGYVAVAILRPTVARKWYSTLREARRVRKQSRNKAPASK